MWPGGCDNAGLEDSLRDQVRKWKLQPAVANLIAVQINALVTFKFNATQDQAKALPTLSDFEVRKLAAYTAAPSFPRDTPGELKAVIIKISLDETGKLTGAGPASEMPKDVFLAVYQAVAQWRFHPYVVNGKAQYVRGTLRFPSVNGPLGCRVGGVLLCSG